MNNIILIILTLAYIFSQQGCSREKDINCNISSQFNEADKSCVEKFEQISSKKLCSCNKIRFKSFGQIRLTGTPDRRGITIAESRMFRLIAKNMDFSFGNFIGTSIANSDFTGSNFSYSNLSGVKFERSIFTSANFSGAQLRDAYFYRTDIRNCSFQGADLSNVHLFLNRVEGCTFDSKTKLPFLRDVAIRMGMIEVF